MINKKEKEKKHGLMEVYIKVNIKMEKNKDMEYLNGLMEIFMKEILIIML